MKSNLAQRIVFGTLGAVVVVAAVSWNLWSFFALFFLITLFALYEFFSLLNQSGIYVNRVFALLGGGFFFLVNYLVQAEVAPIATYYALIAFIFLLFLLELFQQNNQPFFRIANTFLGIVYISVPLSFFSGLAFITGTYNWQLPMGMLLLLWANDIGGYAAGRLMGKTKLFERVSPKKTWEGSIGGAVLAMITAAVITHYFNALGGFHWYVLAAIIVVFGSLGDLVESLLKRSLHVKDSGHLIPGHGGFLDRFDGLLIAAPFLVAYLKLML
jgi:phosphatidate cytidylyltransferase